MCGTHCIAHRVHFPEEQFYRFLTLSNERIARHRTQCITRLEKAVMDNEVYVCGTLCLMYRVILTTPTGGAFTYTSDCSIIFNGAYK